MFRLPCPSSHVLLDCPSCTVLAVVLPYLFIFGRPFPACVALLWCSDCPVLFCKSWFLILFWMSNLLAILLLLSYFEYYVLPILPGCLVPAVPPPAELSQLSSPGCPLPAVLFQLSCHDYHSPVVLSFLLCSGCPILAVPSQMSPLSTIMERHVESPTLSYIYTMILVWYLHVRYVPVRFAPVRYDPNSASLLLYVPIHFSPERAECSKRPFPDQYAPILFILKGKGCIFKPLFPDFCVWKRTETFSKTQRSVMFSRLAWQLKCGRPYTVKRIDLKGPSNKIFYRLFFHWWTPLKPLTRFLKTFWIWLRIRWDIDNFWLTLRCNL